jgi:hypothetical protein
MVGLADRLHADGSLDPAGRATFTRRARQSVEDGLAAGSRARPVAALPDAAPGDFRPYR